MPRYERPYPFLKWAGGKRTLAARIVELLPDDFEVYAEPFLGGGAVFLDLARRGRIRRAVLSDSNPELINAWQRVQDSVEEVIEATRQWAPDEARYYEVRALAPAEPVVRAARTIWLNKTCFNGLYRLNRSGRFNVPFGKYANPRIVDEENLRACSEALRGVELRSGDFSELMGEAGPGWAVYCDPPYWPMSETANFTYYDGNVFAEAEQRRLDRCFRALRGQGARGVLSNSSNAHTRSLYEGLAVETAMMRRNINRNGHSRGPIEELLVSV